MALGTTRLSSSPASALLGVISLSTAWTGSSASLGDVNGDGKLGSAPRDQRYPVASAGLPASCTSTR